MGKEVFAYCWQKCKPHKRSLQVNIVISQKAKMELPYLSP